MCFQQKGAFSYKCQCQKGYLDLSFEDTEKFLINNLSMASPSTECNCPHKNSELVYCKNCKVAICKQCVKSEHLYHRYIEVKKYKEIIKKNVLDKMKFKEYDSFAKYIAENKETIAKEIKEKGAKKVFLAATFSLFTEGVDKFNKAYQDGVFDAVLSTNLTYRIPELKECEWFVEADLSKYISYIIAAANVNESVANLLDPSQNIRELVDRLNG